MLSWVSRFDIFCFLDNQNYDLSPHRYDCLLGAGYSNGLNWEDLNRSDDLLQRGEWYFGHLAYDLKNSIYGFPSSRADKIGFSDFHFFHPRITMALSGNQLTIWADDPGIVYEELQNEKDIHSFIRNHIKIKQQYTKSEYLEKIEKLRAHILLGDCYEINFCQEFYAEDVSISAVTVFEKLMQVSPNPYSAFYRWNESYLICASPERFLMKQDRSVLSQPMKGTIRRDLQNAESDKALLQQLNDSSKDRSENVMVVDLVRNDLTRICEPSSVKVDELFGIYSFPQVHQMVSTISGQLKEGVGFSDIIKACFPMGSMTGAPKYRVMQLIDEYENSRRGIFSGSVGYIAPDGSFDLNVVIRSIMYNEATNYLSYQVGSGITFYSDPESEWEECLLKAEAIKKVLTGGSAL
jgi:para-aminobenzoate synthetase component 1